MIAEIPPVRCDVCLRQMDGHALTPGVRRHRERCADAYMRNPAFYNAQAERMGIDRDHDAEFAAKQASRGSGQE